MIKNFRVIKIFVIGLLFSVLSLNMVLAADNSIIEGSDAMEKQTEAFRQSAGFSDSGGEDTLVNVVSSVITTVLSLLGIVFLILIIVSGYQWMTAGGNEENVAKAKKRLTNAVIGLIIVLSAYAITWAVFKYLPFSGSAGDATTS